MFADGGRVGLELDENGLLPADDGALAERHSDAVVVPRFGVALVLLRGLRVGYDSFLSFTFFVSL